MAVDDPLTRFTARSTTARAPGPVPEATFPRSPASQGREPYEAFDNQVLAKSVEIRCFRTGLSYSIDYSQLGARLFEFLTGENLSFIGSGYGFVIKGRNLKEILRAINLHTCGFIQDFHPEYFVRPEPVDPNAPYVESIEAVALRPTPVPPKDSGK